MAKSKTLVAYYSRTGSTKRIAHEISSALGCKAEPIREKNIRKGWWGFLMSGMESSRGILPEIEKFPDVSAYDLVVIGTPVWAGTVASPVRAFLVSHVAQLSKVAFFSTKGGSGGCAAFEKMEKDCKHAPLATLGVRASEIGSGEYTKKLKEFVRKLR